MSEPARRLDAPVANAYVNRELSWLEFNQRVLEEALDQGNPLIERLRFLTIFHTNLDEFFMVRVSGLQSQVAAGVEVLSVDGMSPRAQLDAIRQRVRPMVAQAQRCLLDDVLPALEQHGVTLVHYDGLSKSDKKWADEVYLSRIYPILTPLAVGPTHPFPFISNLSLNLAMRVRSPDDGEERFARVKVPLANLPRLIPVGGTPLQPPVRLLFLEDLIAANLGSLFPGMEIGRPWRFRVTRDADLEIREDEAEDLMSTLQEELRKRRFGKAVRLEIEEGMPEDLVRQLQTGLALSDADVMPMPAPLAVPRLSQLLSLDLPELKYRPYTPRPVPTLEGTSLYDVIRQRDVLVHHPFESFDPVVEFIQRSARDDRVEAIKQTLYRTSGDSPIIRALEEAVELGKQVAAIVELKARFDEENNIVWARRLEEAGVHVIYGVRGLKTHSKLAMVVRREGTDLVRYAHIGTGNYNPTTARIYTDLGLFTAHPDITADVADVFNRLTGFARPNGFRQLLVAPNHMKDALLDHIARETAVAREGRPAHIIVKCNSVTHPAMIDALYDASRAGVRVDLIVRGICRLIPGRPGMSDNIAVRSIVGRFLEHDRVFWFHNDGESRVYIGSADWMERNLDRRVEALVPILDEGIRKWIREVMLQRYLDDQARSRTMTPEATYVRIRQSDTDIDVHEQFMADRG
ncbi:MAG: polyphosphate kinase 1 [Myxococcota bacterium]